MNGQVPHTNIKLARNSGYAMIEVLITVVLLSIGLLGMAGLLRASLVSSQLSYTHSISTQLAYDIADRMRANQNVFLFPATAGQTAYETAIGTAQTAPTCINATDNTITNTCTAAEMAQYDLYRWKDALKTQLPSGDGSITGTVAGMTIRVEWQERLGQGAASAAVPTITKHFSMNFVP